MKGLGCKGKQQFHLPVFVTILTECHLPDCSFPLNSILKHLRSCREATATVDAKGSHAGGGGCNLSSCHQVPFLGFCQNSLYFWIYWEDVLLIAFQAFPRKLYGLTKTTYASLAHFEKYKKYSKNFPRRLMEAVTLAWEDCDHFEWPICRNLVHSSGNIKKKLVTAESEGYLLLKVD